MQENFVTGYRKDIDRMKREIVSEKAVVEMSKTLSTYDDNQKASPDKPHKKGFPYEDSCR